jgi:hypothetical protein
MTQVFVVHHNPNNGRYRYPADPDDAVACAKAMIAHGESTWIAGNCRRMIRTGDLLLFKFGGASLRQEPGIYAAAHVTRAPTATERGWVLRYRPDEQLTHQLTQRPLVGRQLNRVIGRSFGASIQVVSPRGRAALERILPIVNDTAAETSLSRGLLILKEPLDKILAGTKTWEVRGKATARRGPIALIESKSGQVVGTCEIVDVVGPLSLPELLRNAKRTGFRPSELPYATTYAWVVRRARRLKTPVPYQHPSGAVIWVCLGASVVREVERVMKGE